MLCSALAFGRLFTLDERYAEAPFETCGGRSPTVKGARGVVVDSEGNAYVIDPLRGRILKVTFRSKPTHRG